MHNKLLQEKLAVVLYLQFNKNIITNHLDVLKRSLDLYSTKNDNLMVIRELNTEVYMECMKNFTNML